MTKLEKVLTGLKCCSQWQSCAQCCPYDDDDDDFAYCTTELTKDALELLKKHKEHEELLTKLGYHWTGSGETLSLCKRSNDGIHGITNEGSQL